VAKQQIKVNKIKSTTLDFKKNLLSKNSIKVLKKLDQSGFQAFLVGGCIRDLLIGEKPKDFDIATNAKPEQIKKIFRNCRLIGKRFRLAHIYFGRELIEVATYRSSEISNNKKFKNDNKGRILRDNVFGKIEEDVFRRDFKCNALYYDICDDLIWDFVDGLNDIKQKQLNFIGNTTKRLKEDPVRMLRAARFKAKLNFKLDHELTCEIKKNSKLLNNIPAARIFDEFLKLFQSGYGKKAFYSMMELNLFKEIFPYTFDEITLDGKFKSFIEEALGNTDERIRQQLSTTPMFLIGVFLWKPILARANFLQNENKFSKIQAMVIASHDIVGLHQDIIAIPKRFSSSMREMLIMQIRFEKLTEKQANKLKYSRFFRAAYDFLLLRSIVGDCSNEVINFWAKVEQQTINIKYSGHTKKYNSKKDREAQ
tara:strand:- start:2864 stop:4135 length:1272 start_codon:yes stop_codon:yes gene_type:complete